MMTKAFKNAPVIDDIPYYRTMWSTLLHIKFWNILYSYTYHGDILYSYTYKTKTWYKYMQKPWLPTLLCDNLLFWSSLGTEVVLPILNVKFSWCCVSLVIFPLNHPTVINLAVWGVSLAGCLLIRQFIFNMPQKRHSLWTIVDS